MSVSESPSFHTWPGGVKRWFERRLHRWLGDCRESDTNAQWFREALADQEIFEWTVQWFCSYMDEFIQPADADEVWVTDVKGDGRRIRYDGKAVSNRCYAVVRRAQQEVARNQDAENYADLDSWLEALHAGQLEWDGPSEKDGEDFVEDDQAFGRSARTRRVRWPRVCRTCGEEFRIEKGTAKNCLDCRAKRQAKRRAARPRLEIVR